ncbi:MAG TPA: hypothetical protein VGB76_16935 [Pyrinomonadaceae bacterium]|jgi:hypothetical protein
MNSPEKTYVQEIAKGLGYLGTWLPTVTLQLGDYGVLFDKYKFIRIGNLSDMNVPFGIRQGRSRASMQYESNNAVTMSAKVAADLNLPNAPITTKVEFSFSRENAVVFKANKAQSVSIQDQAALGSAVMGLLNNGKWNKKHRIITELVSAASTTIIVASAKSSSLELTAQGDVSSSLDIANASLGFMATRKAAMAYSDIAVQGLTPMFRTSGVRTTGMWWWKEDDFQPFGLKGVNALDVLTDEEVADHPEALYFGLDGFEELLSDAV